MLLQDSQVPARLNPAAKFLNDDSIQVLEWRERGHTIFVTGDHGINADGAHGGPAADQREVPLFRIPPNGPASNDAIQVVSHLQIAPTILKLLNVSIPSTMKMPALA